MTTGIEYLKPEKKRRGRGPGKKPTLSHVTLRLPAEVIEFFEANYPNKQAKIREILNNFINQQGANK
jgi:uncharacterized protein (DUF4415 family)